MLLWRTSSIERIAKRSWLLLTAAALSWCLAALDRASVEAAIPSPARSQSQSAVQWIYVPLWSRTTPPPVWLLSIPDGRALLIAKVEEKFAAGEQNFKAG